MKTFVVFVVVVTCISKLTATPPKLGEKQADYTDVAEGFRLVKCNIEGDDLTYEWFHNGIKLEPTSSKFLFFRNSILPAEAPVTAYYQGTYQCKASNKEGALLGPKIKVVFSIVGTFNKSDSVLETKDVTVGKDLMLVCPPRTLSRNVFYHWGGRQRVTGAWFISSKQHYMIMEDGSLLFANVKDEDLEFFNVNKNGVSCSMESKGKTKRLTFSQRLLLKEIGARNTVPFGPTIKTKLKDREVAKGTEFVILRCGAVGLPTPGYSWTITGLNGIERPIIDGQDGYKLQDFNHVLMIESVDTKHDGWYKCKAKSNYGGSEHTDEVKGRISVKGKPQWAPEGELSDASPTEGSGFKWSCKAFGNPDPSYTWLLNGVKLSSTDSYNIDGGDMTFKSISKGNQGLYQCIVENNFGHISSSAVLKVLAPPVLLDSRKCNVSKMNLMFLVDGSGSVPPSAFREFKQFMQLLVKKFIVGPEATHVGVLQYSSKVRTGPEFAIGEHQTMEAVQDAISRVRYHYGAYTFGGYAMRMAKELMDNYNRRDAKNVMVFLMDDGTWDKRLARKLSKTLRNSGTQIIILDLQKMKIMHDIADKGLEFTSDKLEENVEEVATEICT